jgi:hypothetical protein
MTANPPPRTPTAIELVRTVLQNADGPLQSHEIETILGDRVSAGGLAMALHDMFKRGELTREHVNVGKRTRYAYRYSDPTRMRRRTPTAPASEPRCVVEVPTPAPAPAFTVAGVGALEQALGAIHAAAAAIGLRVRVTFLSPTTKENPA